MEFKFLDKDDALLFARSDATAATVSEHELLLRMTLPLDADKQVDRGMRVVFADQDADGADLLRYFEVRNAKTSCIAGTQEIEAEDLLMAELSDDTMSIFEADHAAWNDVVALVLFGTSWTFGTVIPTLPASSVEYDMYEITRPSISYLDLRSAPRSTASSLGRFDNGTLVKEISDFNTDWKKVSVGGKTGYMYRPYLTFDHTVTLSGLPTITLEASYKTRYELLMTVLNKVGLRPIPRLVRSGATLTRYVDYDLTQMDTFRGARIEIDRNAYADNIEYEDRGLYTAVYPIGKDGLTIEPVTWSVSSGDPGESALNSDLLVDPYATALYGRGGNPRKTMQEFSDIEDPDELINAGWAWLQTVNHPRVSVELSAFEMAALGYGGKRMVNGERVNVILQPIGALLQLNVVQLTRDLEQPANTQVTIGAFSDDSVSQAVSTANELEGVKDDAKKFKASYLDRVYPVGSIYLSVASTDPADLFGGAWARIQDMMLMAAGTTYGAGSTGGAAAHKHRGTSGYDGTRQGAVIVNGTETITVDGYRTNAFSASGGSTPDITVPYTGNASSLPPYLSVYVWKRTA